LSEPKSPALKSEVARLSQEVEKLTLLIQDMGKNIQAVDAKVSEHEQALNTAAKLVLDMTAAINDGLKPMIQKHDLALENLPKQITDSFTVQGQKFAAYVDGKVATVESYPPGTAPAQRQGAGGLLGQVLDGFSKPAQPGQEKGPLQGVMDRFFPKQQTSTYGVVEQEIASLEKEFAARFRLLVRDNLRESINLMPGLPKVQPAELAGGHVAVVRSV
jgi:hypothetical protein